MADMRNTILIGMLVILPACNSIDSLRKVQATAHTFAETNGLTDVVCDFSAIDVQHSCYARLKSDTNFEFTCTESKCW